MTVQQPSGDAEPPREPSRGESDEADHPVTAVPGPPPGQQPLPPLPVGPPANTRQMPIPMPPVTRAPAGSAFGYPTRYAEAPGAGQFRLALPQLGTIVAGPAVGSMIAGIASLLVALIAGCAGTSGSLLITVALVVLAVFCSSAAGLLGAVALRQVRRSGGEYRGRGMAIAGLSCGSVALGLVFISLLVALARG